MEKQTLPLILRQALPGMIWKIQVDANGPLLGIESRSPEARFSCVNLQNGTVNFLERSVEAHGQPSLASVSEHAVLLSVYEDGAGPSTKGIIALDPANGNLLWQKFNLAYYDAGKDWVQVWDPRIQPRRIHCLDVRTGSPCTEIPVKPTSPATYFPEEASDEQFAWLSGAVGEVMALNHGFYRLRAFHENSADGLQQRILVYQGDKKIHDDIIISGIQKLQPEAFFIHQNRLLYIRNKNEIVAYLL